MEVWKMCYCLLTSMVSTSFLFLEEQNKNKAFSFRVFKILQNLMNCKTRSRSRLQITLDLCPEHIKTKTFQVILLSINLANLIGVLDRFDFSFFSSAAVRVCCHTTQSQWSQCKSAVKAEVQRRGMVPFLPMPIHTSHIIGTLAGYS